MKLVPDATHRFTRRPHYEPHELDFACEDLVATFLRERRGALEFPIATDDLTVLIEREVDDLDSAADLGDLGDDIEGVTDFFRGKKPRVRIAAHLWDGASRENRLRTTLAHEFGHVHFHNYLYQVEAGVELFVGASKGAPLRCLRQSIHGGTLRDWMEWQAGYVSGALLMPISRIREVAATHLGEQHLIAPVGKASVDGLVLAESVATAFQVSHDAARVRLSQLGYLTDTVVSPLTLGLA